MALPPKDDPHRPIAVAIRWLWAAAAVFLILTVISLSDALSRPASWRQVGDYLTFITAIYGAPGVLFLICAIYVRKHAGWAISTAAVLSMIEALLTCISALFGMVILVLQFNLRNAVMLVIVSVIGWAFVRMALAMEVARRAIKYLSAARRGFEPVMPDLTHQNGGSDGSASEG